MRKLFLHIGTHKTGTTSLQSYLMANRERLGREGVAVCTEDHAKFGLIANCIDLPNAVLRPGLMTVARMTGDAKPSGFWQHAKAAAHVKKFLSERGASQFVLSAEAFCFARDDAERDKTKKMFSTPDVAIVPVVCFRNEAAWRESWFGEIERWRPKCRHGHGEGTGDIRGDWYFDKDAIVRFWQQIGDVRTIDYDAAVRDRGSVLPALLDAMEIADAGDTEKYFLNARN